MSGWFGLSKKKDKIKKAGPDKYEEPIKKPQQLFDTDTNTSIVINGAGPRDTTTSERKEDEDEMPDKSRIGQNDVKQTSQVTHELKKKKPYKPKYRHNQNNQESSDSETDSSSYFTCDESTSADDSNDSPGSSERSQRYHADGKNDYKKRKVLKDDSLSRSSTHSSDESSSDMNGAPPMGIPTSAGSHGQGGNNTNKSRGGKGHIFNVSCTGPYLQVGENPSMYIYNISNDTERKKKSSRSKQRGLADAISSCKESATMPTSSPRPEDISEVRDWKLQKSFKEMSTAYDNGIQVHHLGRPSGSSAGNMRAQFNETESVFNQRVLVDLAKSIGIIRSPYGTFGTGFRVGFSYIMTAKHVKDSILNAVPSQLRTPNPPPRILHLNDAFIDFAYEVSIDDKQSIHTDDNQKFYFEPKIVYENVNMDTVILQLKPNKRMDYPPPLTNFAELSDPNGQLYLIGHSKAEIKRTDKFSGVQLTNEINTKLRQWSQSFVGVDGFTGIENTERELLNCSFEKGASGSPGVWIYGHCPYIVTMLLCGYPEWFYRVDFPSEEKNKIQHYYLVEQGVRMKSLYEDIYFRDPILCEEIFCFNSLLSQTNDDVDMTSNSFCVLV